MALNDLRDASREKIRPPRRLDGFPPCLARAQVRGLGWRWAMIIGALIAAQPFPVAAVASDESRASPRSDAAEWEWHACTIAPGFALEGQTARVADGGGFIDHRREAADVRAYGLRTIVITEEPQGALSERQWHARRFGGYGRYSISVVYDIDICLLAFCWTQARDVESSCDFDLDA